MASIIVYLTRLVVLITVVLSVLLLAYRAYGDSPGHRSNVLQLTGGVIIVTMLYYASLLVLHQDKLVSDTRTDIRKPQKVNILDGFIEVPLIVHTRYETLDPRSASYLPLPQSFNRRGGAQFTYQFWIILDDVSSTNVANKIILMRGDTNTYAWNDISGSTVVQNSGIAIACPSISFGATYDRINVAFNTLDRIGNLYQSPYMDGTDQSDPVGGRNLMKLMSKRWVLITVVFEDNVPVNEFEDGLRLRLFVNEILYDYQNYPGQTLRQNNGPLTLFPANGSTNSSISQCRNRKCCILQLCPRSR